VTNRRNQARTNHNGLFEVNRWVRNSNTPLRTLFKPHTFYHSSSECELIVKAIE